MVDESFRNKEVVMVLSTDLQTEQQFFTDTNGLGFNVRTTDTALPTSGNFYPITTHAAIRDSQYQLSVLCTQGMVH